MREFASRYANPGTRRQYEAKLAALFARAGVDDPGGLTEAAVLRWCGRACRDGTDLGLRDEAVIRLGLAGMRAAEIIRLRVGDLRFAEPEPRIVWIGKKRRARTLVAGPTLVAVVAVVDALVERQASLLGRPLGEGDPVVCCGRSDMPFAPRPTRSCAALRACSRSRSSSQRRALSRRRLSRDSSSLRRRSSSSRSTASR